MLHREWIWNQETENLWIDQKINSTFCKSVSFTILHLQLLPRPSTTLHPQNFFFYSTWFSSQKIILCIINKTKNLQLGIMHFLLGFLFPFFWVLGLLSSGWLSISYFSGNCCIWSVIWRDYLLLSLIYDGSDEGNGDVKSSRGTWFSWLQTTHDANRCY